MQQGTKKPSIRASTLEGAGLGKWSLHLKSISSKSPIIRIGLLKLKCIFQPLPCMHTGAQIIAIEKHAKVLAYTFERENTVANIPGKKYVFGPYSFGSVGPLSCY